MKNLTTALVIMLATYAAASFVTAEVDFRKWGESTRFITLFLGAAAAFLYITFPEHPKKP